MGKASNLNLSTRVVDRSLSQLQSVYDGVALGSPTFAAVNVHALSASLDVETNSVVVDLDGHPTKDGLSRVRATFPGIAVTASGVRYESTANSRNFTGVPINAGTFTQNAGAACTASIEVITTSPPAERGQKFLVTAGHCELRPGSRWQVGSPGSGRSIGVSHGNSYRPYVNGGTTKDDSMAIDLPPSEGVTSYAWGGGPATEPQPSISLNTTGGYYDCATTNQPVWASGYVSGYIAGTTTGPKKIYYSADTITVDGFGTSLDTRHGDSGGPVLADEFGTSNQWIGVVSGGSFPVGSNVGHNLVFTCSYYALPKFQASPLWSY